MTTPQNQSTTPQPQPNSEQLMLQMLQQMQAMQLPQPQAQLQSGSGGWGAVKPAVPPALGVLVPISIENNGQNCGLYLQYGPEFATPDAILGLVGALIANGVPVKTWAPKSSGWGKK